MDAIHVARGATGRDLILKIEGSYHGHHDAVMVSVYPPLEELGDRDDPRSVPYGAGYPRAITELTRSVPFNDAGALERVLAKLENQVAALIMEPAMMNINIVPPIERLPGGRAPADGRARSAADLRRGQDGRDDLARRRDEAFRREARHDHARQGRLRRRFRAARSGMTDELASVIANGTVHQYGTFNGNPLVMAAAHATLTEVLTDGAYDQLERTQRAAAPRLRRDHRALRPTRVTRRASGAKGCVVFAAEPTARVPRLPDEGRRRPLDARLALPHEPRHLHDAGRRGGVDALRSRTPTSTSSATSTPSRPSQGLTSGARALGAPSLRLSK